MQNTVPSTRSPVTKILDALALMPPGDETYEITFGYSLRVNRWWLRDESDRQLLSFELRWWPGHNRPSLWFSVGPFDLTWGWFELCEVAS